jgi:hypothetical protein
MDTASRATRSRKTALQTAVSASTIQYSVQVGDHSSDELPACSLAFNRWSWPTIKGWWSRPTTPDAPYGPQMAEPPCEPSSTPSTCAPVHVRSKPSTIPSPDETAMVAPATVTLRASLAARLYRDIEVSSSNTLAELAEAIIAAFDFDMHHAYGFYSRLTGRLFDSPRRFELFADMEGGGSHSVKLTRIITAFKSVRSAMTLLYDYGDEWLFRVEVIEAAQAKPGADYPRMVKKLGKAPEQYRDIDDE